MAKDRAYQILETLYQGNKTIIYRAIRQADRSKMILKVLVNEYPDPLELARFRKEFQRVRSLKIEGVPQFVEFGKLDTRYFISLKDDGSISLSQFFSGQVPGIPIFLRIAIQLSEILDQLHQKGIIHKDLKPDNILIQPDQARVTLIDFGLSSHVQGEAPDLVSQGSWEGSLAYLSPEQSGRMNRPIDHRSDFYALGISFFEMLTGSLPFQASSPLEWVHVQLAREVPDPRDIRKDIPEMLVRIIRKLSAKMAEDRYQSAAGLKFDLEECLRQWQETKKIASFPLGARDISRTFRIPFRIYGRDQEIDALADTIQRIIQESRTEMVLVSGEPGIGKTVFVREVQKQVVAAKGFFLSGKFDQFNRGTPYQGLSHAFGVLARQLLAEPEPVILKWRRELSEALGNNVGIINELIPEFAWILGVHPPPPSLPPEETMNRFLYTWKAFFKTIARADHPLILFLDDLQWADLASLQLIEQLFADPDIRSFCFIGSYRDSEVDEFHPLAEITQTIKGHNPFQEIHLSPLSRKDINHMLADTFHRPLARTEELAVLLRQKTEGNPFFLIEALKSLQEENGIFFDTVQGKWSWDMKRIQAMAFTENVVDLMVNKIRKCSADAQKNLMLAACIGHEFSLRALAWINRELSVSAITEALDQGLIHPTDDNYLLLYDAAQSALLYQDQEGENEEQIDAGFRFLHDRVQQAAYSQLSANARKSIHLKLGQRLLAHTPDPERNERIFDICNHINLGASLVEDPETKARYAGLNLDAARKAIASNAYEPALAFLGSGIDLLPDEPWSKHYDLAYALWMEAAQCHFLTGRIGKAEEILKDLLVHAQSRLHRLRIYRRMVDMYTIQVAHDKVLETVKEALALFNIHLPRHPVRTKSRVLADLLWIKFRLRNTKPLDMLDFPVSKDPEHIELSSIILTAGPSAYLSDQDLFAWMVLFEVKNAIRQGHTRSTPLGYMGYGMIVQKVFGDLDTAYDMAETALLLNEKLGNSFPAHRLKFTFSHFIKHFREDASITAVEFSKLYRVSLESGDLIYTGFIFNNLIWNGAVRGKNLASLCQEGMKYLKILSQQKNINSYDLLLTRLQALLILNGQPPIPWQLDGEDCTLEEKRTRFRTEHSYAQLAFSYASSFQLAYLLDDTEIRLDHILEADNYTPYLVDTYSYADFGLMVVLAAFKLAKEKGTDKHRLLRIANRHRATMRKRAKQCPDNYRCHYLLIDGLYARMRDQDSEANRMFEATIESAGKKEWNHLLALAKELLGTFYLANEQFDISRFYLRESTYAYRQWGASAKVKQLARKYPELLLSSSPAEDGLRVDQRMQISTSGTGSDLDLESLMKSAISISSEIVLEKLLPAMIHIAVENAGAQCGYLLLAKDGALTLNAHYELEGSRASLIPDLPLEENDALPKSIIHYTFRTGETVVLDYAAKDDRFSQDPYFADKDPKSILCHPLKYQARLIGIIYLENNLIVNAFGEKQVKVLRILSAQIAISLQNALLYKDLERSLDKQTRLTEAYSRFTPREYLRFLGRDSILDARLGDNRHADMVVLFSDIRSYTTLSEQMTPDENFQFMANYLERMSQIISRNNGIVNQLLGDGIMAFFFIPEDALKAAIDMQLELQKYNEEREAKGRSFVRAGAGLHKGPVIMGIVGNEARMGITISSDTVNTASRIEGLTKYYGANILLSEAVARELGSSLKKGTRQLGRVKVKGKLKTLDLLECFAGDKPGVQQRKSASLRSFHRGQDHFFKGHFKEAARVFQQICHANPDDLPAKRYLEKARHFLETGVPEGWSGVEEMEMK